MWDHPWPRRHWLAPITKNRAQPRPGTESIYEPRARRNVPDTPPTRKYNPCLPGHTAFIERPREIADLLRGRRRGCRSPCVPGEPGLVGGGELLRLGRPGKRGRGGARGEGRGAEI